MRRVDLTRDCFSRDFPKGTSSIPGALEPHVREMMGDSAIATMKRTYYRGQSLIRAGENILLLRRNGKWKIERVLYMGGWKNPQTVLTVYQQPDTELQREALATRKKLKATG